MSRLSFEQYAVRAKSIADPLMATARLPMHRGSEGLVVADIVRKLRLTQQDRLLDIGSGIGDLTIPLAFHVGEITAVDSQECLDRLSQRSAVRVNLWPGNWLDIQPEKTFTCILSYSVIHYLSNMDEVNQFISKAVSLLEPGGRMLIGDIPSPDLRSRFNNSAYGMAFNTKWNRDLTAGMDEYAKGWSDQQLEDHNRMFVQDKELVRFDDKSLLEIVWGLRASGFQAWLLPQDIEMPFGSQREDLLIWRP